MTLDKMLKTDFTNRWVKILQLVFLFFCITATFFSLFALIRTYTRNEDSSKILYKSFDDYIGNDTMYPMISICIVTFPNKSLIREGALTSGSSNATNYNLALMGELDFEDNKLPNDVGFDDVALHLKDYVDSFEIEDLNMELIGKWDSTSNQTIADFPFYKSYQDPRTMCFSWNTNNYTLSYVKMFLSKNKIAATPQNDHEYYFYIYLTNNHQLIRNMLYLHKEDLWYLQNKSHNHIRIDVTGISRLRLRQNANSPCNELLKNDDLTWMKYVIQEVGCVPLYWKFNDYHSSIPDCNLTKEYGEFTKYFARKERKNVYEIFDNKYIPPCSRMRILSSIKFLDYYKKDEIKIDFRYLTREFEEIQNVRDMDLETLVGNIGGYVGMILGISVLQMSYLFVSAVKTLLENLKLHMKHY